MSSSTRPLSLLGGDWLIDEAAQVGTPGEFGAVFRGKSADGATVAIKILRSRDRNFRREIDISSLLLNMKFEYVVPVIDLGYDPDLREYAIVMPLAQEDLNEAIRRNGPMSERKAASVLLDVVRGLRELSPHLVHRDLKPANILFHQDKWKIADFGTSRLIEATTTDMTTRQWLSAQYAAPEQWELDDVKTAADVYALGCAAYYIVTGEPPFQGNAEELRFKHCNCAPPLAPGASNRYNIVIEGCMQKLPKDRPDLGQLERWIEMINDDFDRESKGATALSDVAARILRNRSEQEARTRQRAAAQVRRQDFVDNATKRLTGVRDHLFNELLDRVPGSQITQISELMEPEVVRSFLGQVLSHTKKYRTHTALLVTDSVLVHMADVTEGPFILSPSNERLCCASLAVARKDERLERFGAPRPKARQVRRLLLFRPDSRGDYRWYEYCAYRPPVAPVPAPSPESATRSGNRIPADDTRDARKEKQTLDWEGRTLKTEGTPIDDEAIYTFIDRWLLVVAKAIEDALDDIDDAICDKNLLWKYMHMGRS